MPESWRLRARIAPGSPRDSYEIDRPAFRNACNSTSTARVTVSDGGQSAVPLDVLHAAARASVYIFAAEPAIIQSLRVKSNSIRLMRRSLLRSHKQHIAPTGKQTPLMSLDVEQLA